MADEVDKQELPVEKPEPTEHELRAREDGWVPKEEWEGPEDKWRPAKEFLDRGELFKKIDQQNKTIKQFETVLKEFAKHHESVRKVEYDRALADLKAAKKVAVEEGDGDAVVDLDDKIDMVKEAQRTVQAPKVPDTPVSNPVFENWLDKNSWYKSNEAMRAYADKVGLKYGTQGMSPNDVLREVEQAVKKEFAHKFNNPKRDAPGAVEGGGNTKSGGKKESFELTSEQRRVAEKFVRTIPGYTMEKYVEELKRVNGV